MTGDNKLRITCPDCRAEIVIDATSGQVLLHQKAKEPMAGGATLDSLREAMEAKKSRAEDLFEKEKAAVDDSDRLLEQRFREAMDQAAEKDDEDPPLRPFDLD